MLGVGAPANYIVLSLDRSELRPGGGFQGNYGVLSLEGGKQSQDHPLSLHDVYALDAGTVEACADLLRRAAAAGSRFLPLRYGSVAVDCLPADWPGPLVFLGESIPGREPAQRWADLRRLARTLIRRRLAGRTSLRVPGFPGSRGQPDSAARAARALLALGCTPADLLPR